MSITLTSPVTGAAQTGFTSPTYTLTADTAPDVNGKQYAVTALGGTQVGVTAHSVASPFTITFVRPKVFRNLGKANPTTGVVKDVPRNTYKAIIRKGVTPLAGQTYQNLQVTVTMDVPAGSDTADPANVRAALSLAFGALWQQPAGIGDTLISGILG
jgi:hypothetical protein